MTTDIVPAIELRHVTKRFGSRNVLDDLTLSIPARQGLCLLGRSGTGKSVMLKHIVGLIKPDVGEVLVEGGDIAPVSYTHLTLPTILRV